MPLPTGQDILTEVLRDGARRMLAQAIEAEAATWIEAHAHLSSRWRGVGLRYLFSTYPGSARTRIGIPTARPSSSVTNHGPDTASSDRPIPATARWRIAVHVFPTPSMKPRNPRNAGPRCLSRSQRVGSHAGVTGVTGGRSGGFLLPESRCGDWNPALRPRNHLRSGVAGTRFCNYRASPRYMGRNHSRPRFLRTVSRVKSGLPREEPFRG